MTEPDQFTFSTDEFLTVRIAGAGASQERLLLVGRPRDGLVRVREWTTGSLNAEGEDYDVEPLELLADIETAYASALQVTPEMHRIRYWMQGVG